MTDSMPLLSMLSQKMSWLSARQSVLAQNVANADTPGYSSRDVKAPDFAKLMANASEGTSLSVTNPLHIAHRPDDSGFEMVSAESSEGSPTGNSVSLEQEIMKLSDTQIQYQTATNLYRKAVNMFQIALGHERLSAMDFNTSLLVAASGMRAQSGRMRIIAENLANANSSAASAGGEPYRRRIATMSSEFDRQVGATVVKLDQPAVDQTEFRSEYDPGNPASDKNGYVKLPNVNALVEMMDMRDAQRSYEANLQMMDAARNMLARTVDLLRS